MQVDAEEPALEGADGRARVDDERAAVVVVREPHAVAVADDVDRHSGALRRGDPGGRGRQRVRPSRPQRGGQQDGAGGGQALQQQPGDGGEIGRGAGGRGQPPGEEGEAGARGHHRRRRPRDAVRDVEQDLLGRAAGGHSRE